MSPRDRLARLLARLRGWLGSGDRGSDDAGEESGARRGNGDRAGRSDDRILVYASDERAEAARELDEVARKASDRSGTDRDDGR